MQLIGQFNNAFLLARLGPELFMIDQHAADEKFNFEWLQARATVRSQNLIEAQPLQLGSVNEALLKDNLELFRRNGFEFTFGNWLNNENEEEEDGVIQMEPANHQQKSLLLTSTPNIKGYHFDKHGKYIL
jgi:DNA mismatch repair ATPase MutL